MKPHLGLTGFVTVEVLNQGKTVGGPVTCRNLWLDQGLDNLAAMPLSELFKVAVKGIDDTPTTEDLTGTSNTYSIPNNTSTMTRAAGSRDFTSDDVGKLMRFVGGREFKITGFTSATVVSVSPPASPAVTTLKGTLYSVHQVGMGIEEDRTDTYSVATGENSTVTADNVRTLKRTFIFGPEDFYHEFLPGPGNSYQQAVNTLTRLAGTRDFTTDDVGSRVTYLTSGQTGTITAFTSATEVTTTLDANIADTGLTITATLPDMVETPTGSYARSGTTVTRTGSGHVFGAPADIGKIIHFIDDNVDAKITAVTNSTTVTVDVSGTLAGQAISIHSYNDYPEFGFSHSPERGDNINIRVVLSSAVRANVSTPSRSADQIKVSYSCQLTIEPDMVQTGSLATVISDPSNEMSGNKTGGFVIETFATSKVLPSGESDLSLTSLEPFDPGFLALSLNTDALVPLTGKARGTGASLVPMEAAEYVDGSFTQSYTGVFGLNDAISASNRSLMLYDPDSQLAVFTFLFNVAQQKDGDHTLTMVIGKTWGRDLS